jgi:hypothetical protein
MSICHIETFKHKGPPLFPWLLLGYMLPLLLLEQV